MVSTRRNPLLSMITIRNRGAHNSFDIVPTLINRINYEKDILEVHIEGDPSQLHDVHDYLGLSDRSITEEYARNWQRAASSRDMNVQFAPHLYDAFENNDWKLLGHVFRQEIAVLEAAGIGKLLDKYDYKWCDKWRY